MRALELAQPTVIEFHRKADDAERLLEYFRSASVGVNKANIKEYGKAELISRNPAAENITISENDNIVAWAK